MVENKTMKMIILLMILTLLIPSISVIAKGASGEKQRIYDYGELLNEEEVEKLEKLSHKYSKRREVDIIVLTTNDTDGLYVEQYMGDFYDENALGYNKAHGNTAILTIDMGNRDVNISGFYKGKEYLDNRRADMVQDKIGSKLSSGDYYGAIRSFIKTSYKYMGVKPGMNPNNILFNIWFQVGVSLIIAGIIVATMFYRSSGKTTVHEGTYRDSSSSRVVGRRDTFIRKSVQRHRKSSRNDNSGGGGSGRSGGSSQSSGGHSHSSSTRKF